MKRVALLILDGWGIAQDPEVSAIDKAQTPFIDSLYQNYPHTSLQTSGLAVGLPAGQMGNSEVGHMHIGAGRTVYQMLVKIDKAVSENKLGQIEQLVRAFTQAKTTGKKVHLMGLVSDGGIHAHIDHLKGLLRLAKSYDLERVFLHAFTDGRDTDPKSGLNFIRDMLNFMRRETGQLASVIGRYYAMDRDKRWERIARAYHALVHAKGQKTEDILNAIAQSYEAGITDEFLKPLICTTEQNKPRAKIEAGDIVLYFNFRTDRARELSLVLTQTDMPDHNMKTLDLDYLTMTEYDQTFKNLKVLFENQNLKNTLGEVLSKAGKTQIRIAETEKYPHVTFFFSGGRETEFEAEKRLLCPSPKVATYDLKPAMSAWAITEKIIPELNSKSADFICLNFANPDMVGHTGVFEAAVKACETVDQCTAQVVEAALAHDYAVMIIADHGNADFMINPDGTPNTAHTTNLVPCFLIASDYTGQLKPGTLANIAPTILELMGLEKPDEMHATSLLQA